MATRSPLLVLALVLALGSNARADDPVREAIEAGNRTFIAAFERGDAQALATLYTTDAQVIGPGAPVASGHPAIAAFWKGVIDSGIQDVALTTADVVAAGDLAAETGTVRLVAKDGAVTEDRYVVVWKRRDGAWRMFRDIWNAPPR
jgi:uncharacterized protein (TIGR02246 family)